MAANNALETGVTVENTPEVKANAGASFLSRIGASSIGGILTVLVTTPLDVVKTRMQVHDTISVRPVALPSSRRSVGAPPSAISSPLGRKDPRIPQGPHRCLTCGGAIHRLSPTVAALMQLGRHEGLKGLYSGIGPTLAMTVPQTVMYFSCYDTFKGWLATKGGAGPVVAPVLAGGGARLLTATAVAPLELIRTRMQGSAKLASKPAWSALRKELKLSGPRGLWTGLGPTLWRDVPFSMIYWSSYDFIMSRAGQPLSGGGHKSEGEGSVFGPAFVAGLGAGTFATILTHPFDVVKTRAQTQGASQASLREWSWSQLIELWRVEGVKGVFTGLGARTAKVAPACAIMISVYEGGKRFLSTTG